MEFIRIARKLGNSAGVLLPKKLLNCEVKVSVIKRPIDIKKIVLKSLNNFLSDIQGIYILNKNPLEVLAVSNKIRKLIKNEKIKINLVPLSIIRKDIKNEKLREKLSKAEVILNSALLDEIKKDYNFDLLNERNTLKSCSFGLL